MRIAALNPFDKKQESYQLLEEANEIMQNNPKISRGEKMNSKIMINNTKKDICYRRKEMDEALGYLQDQLVLAGDNEMQFGPMKSNVLFDISYILYELQRY